MLTERDVFLFDKITAASNFCETYKRDQFALTRDWKNFYELYKAIKELPFGEDSALPWCIESFPRLQKAIKVLEKDSFIGDENTAKNSRSFKR